MANSTADSSFSTYGLENELSGYKAVSGSAIFSAIMGVLSMLMFVDPLFFFIPLLAVLFGFVSLRRIRKYPDVYTGLKLAQAGIGLGLLFTLVSFSTGFAYKYLLDNEAKAYAMSLENVLKTGRAEEILFLKVPKSQREELTPDKLVAQRLEGGMEGKMGLESDMKPLQEIVKDREAAGAVLAFDQIEMAGFDKLTPFAYARYSIVGGAPSNEHTEGDGHDHSKDDGHDHKDGEPHDHDKDAHEHKDDGHDHAAQESESGEPKFVLVQIKAEKVEGKNSWYIAEVVYPYKKGTAKPTPAKVDDGHGHAH